MVARIIILALAFVIWQADSQLTTGGRIHKNPLRPSLTEESPISSNTLRRPFADKSSVSCETSSSNYSQTFTRPSKVTSSFNNGPSIQKPLNSLSKPSVSDNLSSLGKANPKEDETVSQSSKTSNSDGKRPILAKSTTVFAPESFKFSSFSKAFPSSLKSNITYITPRKSTIPSTNVEVNRSLTLPKPFIKPLSSSCNSQALYKGRLEPNPEQDETSSPLSSQPLSSFSGTQKKFLRPSVNPLLNERKIPFAPVTNCGSQLDSSGSQSTPTMENAQGPSLPLGESSLQSLRALPFSYNSQICKETRPNFIPEPSVFPVKPSPSLKPSLPNLRPSYNVAGSISSRAQVKESLPNSMSINESPILSASQISNLKAIDEIPSSIVESTFIDIEKPLSIQDSNVVTAEVVNSDVISNINPIIRDFSSNMGYESTVQAEKNNLCNSLLPSTYEINNSGTSYQQKSPFLKVGAPRSWNGKQTLSGGISDTNNQFTKFEGRNNLAISSGSPVFSHPISVEPPKMYPSSPWRSSNYVTSPAQNAIIPNVTISTKYPGSYAPNQCGSFDNPVIPFNTGPLRNINPTSQGLKEVLKSLPGHVGITGIVNTGVPPCYKPSEPTVPSAVITAETSASISTSPSLETIGAISSGIPQSTSQSSAMAEVTNSFSSPEKSALSTSSFSSTEMSPVTRTTYSYLPNSFSSPVITDNSSPFINTGTLPSKSTQSSVSLAETSNSVSSNLAQTSTAASSSITSSSSTQVNPIISNPSLRNIAQSPSLGATSLLSTSESQSKSTGSIGVSCDNQSLPNLSSSNIYNSAMHPTSSYTSVVPAASSSASQSSASAATSSSSISPGFGQSNSQTTFTASTLSSNIVPSASSSATQTSASAATSSSSSGFGQGLGQAASTASTLSSNKVPSATQTSASAATSSSSISPGFGQGVSQITSTASTLSSSIVPSATSSVTQTSASAATSSSSSGFGQGQAASIASTLSSNIVPSPTSSATQTSASAAISSSSISPGLGQSVGQTTSTASTFSSNITPLATQTSASAAASSSSVTPGYGQGLGQTASTASTYSGSQVYSNHANSYSSNILRSPKLDPTYSPTFMVPTATTSVSAAESSSSTSPGLRNSLGQTASIASTYSLSQESCPETDPTCSHTSIVPTATTTPTQSAVNVAKAGSFISSGFGQAASSASSSNITPFVAGPVNSNLASSSSSNSASFSQVGSISPQTSTVPQPKTSVSQSSISVAETGNSGLPSVKQTSFATAETTNSIMIPPGPEIKSPNNVAVVSTTSLSSVAESKSSTSTTHVPKGTTNLASKTEDYFVPAMNSPNLQNINSVTSSASISEVTSPVSTHAAASATSSVNAVANGPRTPLKVEPANSVTSTATSSSSTTEIATSTSSVSTTSTAAANTVEQAACVLLPQELGTSLSSTYATSEVSKPNSITSLSQPSLLMLTQPIDNLFNLEISPVTLEVEIPSCFDFSIPCYSFGSMLPCSYGPLPPLLMYELELPSSIPAQFAYSVESMPLFYTNDDPFKYSC